MADDDKPEDVKITQGRSPAYPYCSLPTAIERAEKVRDAGAARQAMPPETFYKIWGIGAQSSGARQTMAALNHFGLVDYVGRGDDRRVQLSDLARRIVLDKEPNSASRQAAIREAATTPTIHADLFGKYGPLMPADAVVETYLVRDRGYNDSAAKALIREYKDTMALAGLDKLVDLSENPVINPERTKKPEVGDLVQVEIGGALQLEKATRVRAVQEQDGKTWIFVEGSETGIPMDQVIIEAKADPATIGTKPPTLALDVGASRVASAPTGYRKEAIALDEGDVTVIFPERLSPESYEELDSHLQLFLKRQKRRAAIERATIEKMAKQYGKDVAGEG